MHLRLALNWGTNKLLKGSLKFKYRVFHFSALRKNRANSSNRPDIPMAKLDLITAELRQWINNADLSVGDIIPTQKQFANKLGVAVGTIHQAMLYLQEEGLIITTRGRGTVLAQAPNARRANDAEKRLGLIGLNDLANPAPVTASTLQSIQREREKGSHWKISMMSCVNRFDRKALQQWAKDLDAIAVLEAAKPDLTRLIQALGKPTLFTGELLGEPCPPWASQLSIDFEATMMILIQFLMSMGHRRITLVREGGTWAAESEGTAFMAAARQFGLQETVQQAVLKERSDEKRLIEEIQQGNNGSTGLIVDGGLRAGRLLHLCLQENIRIPEDLSLLALSSVAPDLLVTTDLSRLESDPDLRARRILKIADEIVQDRVIIRERMTPQLIWGKTCAPPRGL